MTTTRLWLIVATLVVGSLWGTFVPPFESPDESFYYKTSVEYARGLPRRGRPLYAMAMAPVLKAIGTPTEPLELRYNPAFRFVSNRHGHVNMFMHGRIERAPRADIRRMYVMRFVTLCLWLVALILTFETARLFFGRRDLALLTSGLCLCLPGVAFFASKIHPEAMAALIGALAFWTATARLTGHLTRGAAWIIGLATLALAPLTDHQGYFVLALVPLTLVWSEETWKGAAVAASGLVVLALIALASAVFSNLRSDLGIWLAPFSPSYRYGWWTPDMPGHLSFEFAPKMFLGFVGWLGQPSLLLPPAVYAGTAVAMILAVVGWATRTGPTMDRRQRRVVWIYLAGVLLAFLPILYTNILIDRTAHGRWMYPAVGPIMIGLVSGWRSFAGAFRRHPHLVSVGLSAFALVLGWRWLGSYADGLRLLIQGNHYGDAAHLMRIVTLTVVFLGVVAVALEAAWWLRRTISIEAAWFRGHLIDLSNPAWLLAVPVALNLALLFGFVAPVYRDLDDKEFSEVVLFDASRGEYPRAAALYRIAIAAYPQSTTLRHVAIEDPLIILRGDDDRLVADLRDRIGRGEALQSRSELMALARLGAMKGPLEPELLLRVVQKVEPSPDVNEAIAILKAQSDGRQRDGSAAADVIRAGGGLLVGSDMAGLAILDGFTERTEGDRREIIVYFTPQRAWNGHRLWMHVYLPESHDYLVAAPVIPPFDRWKPRELAWETFELPSHTAYVLYVGIEFEHNLGPAYPLGRIASYGLQ